MTALHPTRLTETTRTESTAAEGAARDHFLRDVLEGLASTPRAIPCKYLYDRRGSELFDRITELEEYYPTRAETDLLSAHATDIAEALGAAVDLVELGSGSSLKTRILLDALRAPARYVPIDISGDYLRASARALSRAYPQLRIEPLVADYAGTITGLRPVRASLRAVFFPGSSIGNFEPAEAVAFLARARALAGPGGVVLVGVDLPKDAAVIERAYDDAAGVTAEFDKNLLVRINRELGADFDVAAFDHAAPWDASLHRVEMRLISRHAQTVRIAGHVFSFAAGEPIVTEHCYKHDADAFRALARTAGLAPRSVWLDSRCLVSMHWLDA